MDRLRAALLGCLLAGGVLFGARPVTPRHRGLRPVVYASGLGESETRVRDLSAAWFQPRPPSTSAAALRAQAGLPCAVRPPSLAVWRDWSEAAAASQTPVPRPRFRCRARVTRRLRPA